MTNARNSFYIALRNQLAVVNPARVVLLRSVQRPGVLVEENESAMAIAEPDIFVLRWTAASIDEAHVLPLIAQTCEISYWTEGSAENGGLDRGRLLAGMDAELVQMLSQKNIAKENYAVTPPQTMATRIFWSSAAFEPVVTQRNALRRTTKVVVYSYQEAGEV